MSRHSVEDRAERWQRRNTGPWATRQAGPLQYRYRRRPRIELVRLWVATHDLGRSLYDAMRLRDLDRWLVRLEDRLRR